jgi:two-component system, sensor histidine kinase
MHGGSVTAYSDGTGRGSEVVAPGGRRVLLVEDHGDGRRMLADLLRLWGHAVEEAEDGLAGLERLRQAAPDVALIDIGLPGLDGYELARRRGRRPAAGCG